jgi:hypothetical protein
MSIRSQEPAQTRLATVRGQAQARAADAAQAAQSAAVAAQSAAVSARSVAATAAGSVADLAQNAATMVNEHGKPIAMEAAARSAAAYQVLRHGVPRSGPMARVAMMMPGAMGNGAGSTMRRARGPLVLMVAGGVGAAGIMAWRRSRARNDELWIVDVDDDARVAAEGWDQGSVRSSSGDNRSGASTASDRMDHPSRRWP